MLEGRIGGSGPRTRRELWSPPYRCSAHPPRHPLSLPTRRSSDLPLISSRRFLTLAPPAGHGEKFRRTRAYVPLGTRLRRDRKRTRLNSSHANGAYAVACVENCGPHLTAVLLNQRIVRCIVYRRST